MCYGRCAIDEWKFKIERKLAGDDGKRSTSSLFPFRRPLRAFFFPHPILSSTTTQRGGSNPTLGAKDFSSANSVTFTFFTPKHPPLARKTSGTKGIGWLIPTDISYRISSNNSRTSINRNPRIIAPLEGIFNIIASLG